MRFVLLLLAALSMPTTPGDDMASVTSTARAMARLLDVAADEVNLLAARAIADLSQPIAADGSASGAQWRQTRAQILAGQIDRVRRRTNAAARVTLLPAVLDRSEDGLRRAEANLRELGFNGRDPLDPAAAFFRLPVEAIESIAQDTAARVAEDAAARVERGLDQHAASAVTVFRSLSESVANRDAGLRGTAEVGVNEAIARGLAVGQPEVADRAIRRLFADPANPAREGVRKLGNKIIQVGKATLSVRDYADIVTRTRMAEAFEASGRARYASVGLRLVRIVGGQSTTFCTAFLGLAVSITGSPVEIDGVTYPTIESLPNGGPPFHPRCTKSTQPFLAGASDAADAAAVRAIRTFEERRAAGRLTAPVAV